MAVPSGVGEAQIKGIAAISANSAGETRAVRIKGGSWKIVPTPSLGDGPYGNILYAVDALSTTEAWAAGAGDSPMVLRWNGRRWNVVLGITKAD